MAARVQRRHYSCRYVGKIAQSPEAELANEKARLEDLRAALQLARARASRNIDHIARLRRELAETRCEISRVACWIRAARGSRLARRRLAWAFYVDRRREEIEGAEDTMVTLPARNERAELSLRTGRLMTNPFKHLTQQGRSSLTTELRTAGCKIEAARRQLEEFVKSPLLSYADWCRHPARAARETKALENLPEPKARFPSAQDRASQAALAPAAEGGGGHRERHGLRVLDGGRA